MSGRPTGSASISIEGIKELNRAFKSVGKAATNDLKGAHADAAKVIAKEAKTKTPRRTGRLAASLRSSGTQRGGVVRAGKASVPYAGPIHFGWSSRGIRPQPFIYEAMDARSGEVLDQYEKQIQKLIDKHGLG